MKQEIAERWIAALRSGQYRQAVNYLTHLSGPRDEHGRIICSHCALGVLVDLYQQETGELNPWPNIDGDAVSYQDEVTEKYSALCLPSQVMRWAGIWNNRGTFKNALIVSVNEGLMLCYSVTSLNDEARLDFDAIADIIQDYYEEL
jgi:hypothetical protein